MVGRVDLVVFGATGFTGQYAVEEVVRVAEEKNLTWGVSGRSKDKLTSLLKKLGGKLGKDFSNVPVFVADVDDEKSLETMASSAHVVINCCGPYRHWGEQVVKACIAGGAHHVDVSGEPQYMERIQLEYHDAAVQKGVYIISACGFDSIPADLGLVFLQEKFQGDLNSVESYVIWKRTGSESGASVHYGTYESAVYGVAHMNELGSLRRKLFPNRLPKMLPALKPRGAVFKSDVVGKWCVPFLGSDRSVMQRSQRYFYEAEKKRPAQIQAYFVIPSLFAAIAFMFFGSIFFLFCKTSFGRKILLKHPKFFSFGTISHEGPSEESMKNTKFTIVLMGEGWEDAKEDPINGHDDPPKKRLTVEVKGTNPAYGATCAMLVTAACTVLKETDKLPGRGGVYPPGAAFAKTSLITELNRRGITFEVVPDSLASRL